MTAQLNSSGAPSDQATHWHSIDWARCHREVRRLQARIVKATQEGRHGRVKALQWLLTHSFSGKALAVKRVTENRGNFWRGWGYVVYVEDQAQSSIITQATGLSSSATEADLHPQSQREAAGTGHSLHDRPGAAGTTLARAGTDSRNNRRPELLWVQVCPVNG